MLPSDSCGLEGHQLTLQPLFSHWEQQKLMSVSNNSSFWSKPPWGKIYDGGIFYCKVLWKKIYILFSSFGLYSNYYWGRCFLLNSVFQKYFLCKTEDGKVSVCAERNAEGTRVHIPEHCRWCGDAEQLGATLTGPCPKHSAWLDTAWLQIFRNAVFCLLWVHYSELLNDCAVVFCLFVSLFVAEFCTLWLARRVESVLVAQ